MPDRFAETRYAPQAEPVTATGRRAPPLVVGPILAGVLLAGCSSSPDTSFSLFVDPGKYQYHNCVQIAGEMKNWTRKRQELKSLMDRADQSAGGAAVGLIAYRGEYVAAGEELEQLQSAARSKKCDQDEAWRSSTVIR